MNPDNDIVKYQISEIRLKLQETPEMRVSVIAGGSEISGQWIALSNGHVREQNLIVYDEKDGVVSETEIAFDMVAAVRIIEPAASAVHPHMRVAPSRRLITEMVVLIEAWGYADLLLKVGDIRVALKEIGSEKSLAPEYPEDMSADFLPEAEKGCLHDILLKCSPRTEYARKKFEAAGTQEIAEIIAEQFKTEALLHFLPKENEPAHNLSEEDWEKIYPHLQVAMALRELRRVSHPFMKRYDLRDIARRI